MAETKTKATTESVQAFLNKVLSEEKRADSFELLKMMERITGEKAAMWGSSIVGFGKYHYKYESGHEGDACLAGFSPRSTSLVVYISRGFDEYDELLSELGTLKTGAACLYIKRLSDIDRSVLEEMIKKSIEHVKKKYKN
jgi:hypothetical protein